jgi:hypothetical protein
MSSKFSGLLQAKQAQSPTVEETVAEAPVVAEGPKSEEPAAVVESAKVEAPVTSPPASVKQSMELPAKTINMQPNRGKKGHPDYNQVTIYLKKETQNKAKIALLQTLDDRDFSELVEDLLTNWLGAQK